MKIRLLKRLNVGASEKYAFRVFLSLLPRGAGFVGVLREHDPADPGRKTDLRRVIFDSLGRLQQDEFVAAGEDPRLFRWNGRLFVLTWLASSHGDWYHWLVDIETKSKIQLKIVPWIYHGKNWVPVVRDNRLLILRSIDPLVVLNVDEKTGICTCIHGRENQQPIGQYRGGGCAYYKDAVITGFGHRTHEREEHTVFHYTINTNNWTTQMKEVQVWGVTGMGIIDPTSQWDGHVACCATPGSWHRWQPAIHGIFRIADRAK
jgi:hypothetical protein